MKIQEETYELSYDPATARLECKGELSLPLEEYAAVNRLLAQVLQQRPSLVSLDVRELSYLNSSGLTVLARFVVKLNALADVELKVYASRINPWQEKSLANLLKLMPRLQLELE